MSKAACPLCRHLDYQRRFEENGHEVLLCHECGLFFIDPFPTNGDERQHVVSKYDYDDLSIIGTDKQQQGEHEYYLEHLGLIEEECAQASSLLDVGCGTGHLLALLGRNNSTTRREGVELNAARAAVARNTCGCPIHEVPIERFSSAATFDVILMINVLSHVPFLHELFPNLGTLLSERGKLVLQVGEMHRNVRRNDVIGWGIPDHVHFLGLDTLDYVCRTLNWKIVRRIRTPYSAELFSMSRLRSPGRFGSINLLKLAVSKTPFALQTIRRAYEALAGDRVYSSFVVLEKLPSSPKTSP